MDEGIALMELANREAKLFEKQSASEKRRLLEFVVSNSYGAVLVWGRWRVDARISPTL